MRRRLTLCVLGGALTWSVAGQAQPGGTPGPATTVPDEILEADEPEEVPAEVSPAPNQVGGHLTLAPSVAWAAPYGNFEAGTETRDIVAGGPSLGLDLAIGIGRDVALGAWGQMQLLGASGACDGCGATSYAGGVLVRYHVVQGQRFDPWVSFGMGARSTKVDLGTSGSADVTYTGFEWFRFAVGGDWYAAKLVAFGPFFELDMGHYLDVSTGQLDDGRAHYALFAGFRGVLSLPGR